MSIVLYGVASGTVNSTLYTISTATGVATTIGTIGFIGVQGIAYNPSSGILYGVSQAALITINRTTGLGTLSGTITPSGFLPSDACFDNSGILYVWNETNLPTDRLATVNLATAVFTNKGASGLAGDRDGLAFKGSTLYLKSSNFFFQVNPITGAVSFTNTVTCAGGTLQDSLTFSGTIGYSVGLPAGAGAGVNGLYSISDDLTASTIVGNLGVASIINSLAFGTTGTIPVNNTFSGVYSLSPGLRHDTIYATISNTTSTIAPPTTTTIDREIPEPSATLYGVREEQ